MQRIISYIFLLVTSLVATESFTFTSSSRHSSNSALFSARCEHTRASFFANVGTAAVLLTSSSPASAKDSGTSKGSKQDPAFEACLSKCIYDCTKPKGDEQKSRTECIPECKKQCATTKAQLMTGTPK
mmetsp:Transcript_1662/g.2374  ORF Transcript_1662/g.2374 Transcript_1662/m.2374 type:complete len:128 (+) Transcript_1662:53-436(+)